MSDKCVTLEPDRGQIENFVNAIFRHAGADGFVAIRSFLENEDKSFRITGTSLADGPRHIVDVAEDDARRAAQNPKPVVFCPPLAVFADQKRAREQDLIAGLALSVECDQNPQQARARLEELLGPATVVVRSGGRWINGSGEEDKLHLHWRLAAPATGENLKKLKLARDLATRIVGGDPSNKPVCHPIRWPGSWHRKAEPRLCTIETLYADNEIQLDTALDVLTKATPAPASKPASDSATSDSSDPESWPKLVADIVTGASYHVPLVKLSARLVGSGTHDGTTVTLLRALMQASTAPHDGVRWRPRFDSIPRLVSTAREKYSVAPASADLPASLPLTLADWKARELDEPNHVLGELLSTTTRALMIAPTGQGKTMFALALGFAVAAGADFLHWPGRGKPARVLYIDGEMSARLLKRRLADAEARFGSAPETFFALSHEDVPGWAPLNTPAGQAAVEAIIERLDGVDLVIFDSIMCLVAGNMRETESWEQVMPWARKLTGRAVGQLWIHHTGHDETKGYGDKTREWQLDLVMLMEPNKREGIDVSFTLTFRKARERTPENRRDFQDVKIALVGDQWESAVSVAARPQKVSPVGSKFFDALCSVLIDDDLPRVRGQRAAHSDQWRAELTRRGLIDPEAKPHSSRTLFAKHRRELVAANLIACEGELSWILRQDTTQSRTQIRNHDFG